MITRIAVLIVGAIAAVVMITLAVANRHAVTLVLDPFNPQRPVVSVQLPFYAYLFAMLVLGVVLGGLATWAGQGKWRRLARTRTQDSLRWKGEADRLARERETGGADKKQLALARR